ncbi:MAG TPA: hypothetical protein DCE41_32795 [Cytophagales bacterium]|nr:hypothetical protein [Cytophagales bacterium]HAA17325.1 hypothetical protein [Cytophagales bacterium]HAP62986.1 hypothetical protein [Cytophagales bacterium]
MEVLENLYANVTLESGTYDHAISVRWKSHVTTEQYLEVMQKVLYLFQDHPSFSVLVMDNTLLPDLELEAFQWTRKKFVSAIHGKITHAYIHFPHSPTVEQLRQRLVSQLEEAGVVVHLTGAPEELQAAIDHL